MSSDVELIFDAKKVLKALNEIEPGLRNKVRQDLKKEVKDLEEPIREAIRSLNPPIGMLSGNGRLSWDNGTYKSGMRVKPDNVLAKFSASRSRRFAVTSLFGLWVRNPAVALTGTIGKGSMVPRYATTKEYSWKGTRRFHTNNGQGRKLLQAAKHNPDNWFYRSGEKVLPVVQEKVNLVWKRYADMVSRKL